MEVRSYSGIERNEHNNIRNLEIIMFNEKKTDKNAYAMSPCI